MITVNQQARHDHAEMAMEASVAGAAHCLPGGARHAEGAILLVQRAYQTSQTCIFESDQWRGDEQQHRKLGSPPWGSKAGPAPAADCQGDAEGVMASSGAAAAAPGAAAAAATAGVAAATDTETSQRQLLELAAQRLLAGDARKATPSSNYDYVKVKIRLGSQLEHYYILSRFLLSRVLTVITLPQHKVGGKWGQCCFWWRFAWSIGYYC